ncbi:MAG TPA: Ig-like domain-containing protein [Actinomycetota bacterium]
MIRYNASSWGYRLARALGVVVLVAMVAAAAQAKPLSRANEKCNGRKTSCFAVADTTAPTIEITAPSPGSSVLTGPIAVWGTASDDVEVTGVEVGLADGPFTVATGTSSWSTSLDLSSLLAGTYTIEARATDAAGNVGTARVEISLESTDLLPSLDTTAPTVAITSPADGSDAVGIFTVSGSASDAVRVALVEVRLGSGSYRAATGTTTWTASLDASSLSAGTYSVVARATDAAGNTATASIDVVVASTTTSGTGLLDQKLLTPDGKAIIPLQRGRLARRGDISYLVYVPGGGPGPWLMARSSTGVAHVPLPYDSIAGWGNVDTAVTADGHLWILGGAGPVILRQYSLSGSGLPTGADLVATRTFGNTDSRPGDLLALASGGLMLAWHQQASNGQPHGHGFGYRSAAGSWSSQTVQFMPTRASKEVLAQHPADGSIWLFNIPDAFGQIGAARLVESGSGFRIDWTTSGFITAEHEGFAPDAENAELAVAADPSTNELVLAYQSNVRRIFSTSPFLAGSYPAVARIRADGSKSFVHLKTYVERVSSLGLIVRPGEVWLAHRPIDAQGGTFDRLTASRYRAGSWTNYAIAGRMYQAYEHVLYDVGAVVFAARMSDGTTHRFLP